MNRNDKLAKKKRLRVKPHNINFSRNDEWHNKCFWRMKTNSLTLFKDVCRSEFNQLCVCVCVWKWKILWGNWTVSHSVIQPKHLRYPLPRNMWYSKFYSPTPQWWSWLPWQHCYLHKCHVQWRGKFTLHKSGFMFLKEGNSCISSIVTIHSG